jgi:soluble lytic murein transglycosylase-like protein
MDFIKSGMLSLIVLASTPSTIEYVAPPINDITPVEEVELTMPQLVDFYADKWGVSRNELNVTVKCESGYNPKAFNGNDIHKNSVGSLGIAQFSAETFLHYAKKMGELEYSNPYDPEQALDVMAYMFSIEQKRHWTCYRKFFE